MFDIDLIPGEYREAMMRVRDVKLAGVAAVVIVFVAIASGAAMNQFAKRANARQADLAQKHALSEQQGAQLTTLSAKRDQLLSQRDDLARLRGGAVVTELMLAIDRALIADDVWFLDWSFRRAGVDDPDVATNGYFIVIDGHDKRDTIRTHMSINGQAVDHSALSKFVRQLFVQPEVQDVRVRQTTVRRYPTHRIVDFELAVILQTKAAG